jgi:acylphosphatase
VKRRGHFICHGRVQGVFFRASAREKAERLGLTGWVSNCPDNTVEIIVEGGVEEVSDFCQWCQHGPPYAHVSRVEQEYSAATGEFDAFHICL